MSKISDFFSDIDLTQRKYDKTSFELAKAIYSINDGCIFNEKKYYQIKADLLCLVENENFYALAIYLENEKNFLIDDRYSNYAKQLERVEQKTPEQWEVLMALHSLDEVAPRDIRDVDGNPVMGIYNVRDLVGYKTMSYIKFDRYKEAYDKDAFGRLIFCDDEYKHLTSKECEEMAYKHVMNFFNAKDALMTLPNCSKFVEATQKTMLGYYMRYKKYNDPADFAKFVKLYNLDNNGILYKKLEELDLKDIYISEVKKDRIMSKHLKKLIKTKCETEDEIRENFVKRCACLITLHKPATIDQKHESSDKLQPQTLQPNTLTRERA